MFIYLTQWNLIDLYPASGFTIPTQIIYSFQKKHECLESISEENECEESQSMIHQNAPIDRMNAPFWSFLEANHALIFTRS